MKSILECFLKISTGIVVFILFVVFTWDRELFRSCLLYNAFVLKNRLSKHLGFDIFPWLNSYFNPQYSDMGVGSSDDASEIHNHQNSVKNLKVSYFFFWRLRSIYSFIFKIFKKKKKIKDLKDRDMEWIVLKRDLKFKNIVYPFYFSFDNLFFKNKTKNYSKLLISLYSFSKTTLLPIFFFLSFTLYSFFVFNLSFLKILSFWLVVLLIVYWLLSGFNFFLKRYRFGKFTSALQRFWKRAFMCFWMIEGFLFSLFVYYLMNSSSEPVFMYDQIAQYNNQLLSWKPFFFNCILIVFAINLLVIALVAFNYYSFRQNLLVAYYISLFLLFLLLIESYQFYYIVNFYDDSFWVFSDEDNVWELEHDAPRTRTKNYYLTLCVLAKFWHYIFIFASWVFFLMKTLELNRFRYTFFSLNLQNVIILYLMNWIFMSSWVKWLFRRFLDKPYYWFFVSNRDVAVSCIITDLLQHVTEAFMSLTDFSFFRTFMYKNDFFYILANNSLNYTKGDLLKNSFLVSIL